MSNPFQPSGYPGWASGTSGVANTTEPSASQKSSGWVVNQAPPSSYMNWLQNLSYQWIKHLDYRTTYSTVFEDDFVRGTGYVNSTFGAVANFSATGLGSAWAVSPTGVYLPDDAGGPIGSPVMGSVSSLVWGYSSYALTYLGSPGNRDFKMEMIGAVNLRASGMSFKFGANSAYFQATGVSSPWWFNFTPSGGSPTRINTGIEPYSPTMSQKFVVERQGATMMVQVSTGTVSLPGVCPAQMTEFGLRGAQASTAGDGFASAYLDRVGFYLRRDPV